MKMLVMALAVVSGVFGFMGTAFAADGLECKDARGCKICSAILPNPPLLAALFSTIPSLLLTPGLRNGADLSRRL